MYDRSRWEKKWVREHFWEKLLARRFGERSPTWEHRQATQAYTYGTEVSVEATDDLFKTKSSLEIALGFDILGSTIQRMIMSWLYWQWAVKNDYCGLPILAKTFSKNFSIILKSFSYAHKLVKHSFCSEPAAV